jgi:hypothetical protein
MKIPPPPVFSPSPQKSKSRPAFGAGFMNTERVMTDDALEPYMGEIFGPMMANRKIFAATVDLFAPLYERSILWQGPGKQLPSFGLSAALMNGDSDDEMDDCVASGINAEMNLGLADLDIAAGSDSDNSDEGGSSTSAGSKRKKRRDELSHTTQAQAQAQAMPQAQTQNQRNIRARGRSQNQAPAPAAAVATTTQKGRCRRRD